jgi:acyl-CoA reductase-like NAD-dependent aldehyde dehydrogenase
MSDGQLLIGGTPGPAASGRTEDVHSPFDGRVVGHVAVAAAADADRALAAAERGAAVWRETPAHERHDVLLRTAALVEERAADIAALLCAENGKTISEARAEVGRAGDMIRLAGYEGTQLYGDTLPLDANRGTGQDKIGFTLRQPCGVVVAITPFNYPSLLVLHKLAPALAAGNAVVLKPARATPLTALALAQAFVDAGLPEGVLSVLTGPGGELGNTLVADPRVRKVSFTGSTSVGEHITRVAGVKKLSLELGASCPVIILPDADLEAAADAISLGGYVNAGQVCISVQRVITTPEIHADFLDALVPKVRAIPVGDPSLETTRLGTLISTAEAQRVEVAIRDAVNDGARLVIGGERDGAQVSPAVVTDVDPAAPLNQDELFGPAVAVSTAADWTEAIRQANSTPYGLGAGVFTSDVAGAVRAMRQIDAGVIHINWTPLWRADLMPYGGLKASGIGKEGFRTAVAEMTEEKTVILHGRAW